MNNAGFSARVAVLLAAVAAALFSLSVIFRAYEDPANLSEGKAGPGAFSISSLGYAALYDLLGRVGWTVRRGGIGESGPARGDILVYAEPGVSGALFVPVKIADLPARTLVVLPKWKGTGNPQRSRWVAEIEPGLVSRAESLLLSFTGEGCVVRRPWPGEWGTSALGIAPSGSGFLQLMRSDKMEELVGGGTGILLGEFRNGGKTIWILSDPDVMSNHGIGNGDNAAFMLALFARLAGATGGAVTFDESVHGYQANRSSPLRIMFELPFAVVTALAFLSALLLILAGTRRFGLPERTADTIEAGKAGLIGNSARLMQYSGHQDAVLRRYVRMAVASAAGALHARDGLKGTALAEWLDSLGRARGVETRYGETLRRMDGGAAGEKELLRCALDAHLWRQNLLGAARDAGETRRKRAANGS
jgi:hypothetical protein